jgi:hypothetical protein
MPAAEAPIYNLSLCKLIKEEFETAWEGYELRLSVQPSTIIEPNVREAFRSKLSFNLTKKDLEGRKILLLEEQGIGDRIMFASVIPDLLRTAAKTSILSNGRLRDLYERSFPMITTYSLEEFLLQDPSYDCALLMGSLCHAFRPSSSCFPGKPFFKPNETKTHIWKQRLKATGKKTVGISWRGGATILNKNGRSLTLEDFLPLFDQKDMAVISIQFGDVQKEIQAFEEKTGKEITFFSQDELFNIDDLSALINALDHVITVQNSNVHICGAIGKSCDVLLPQVPEWRYGLSGENMRWYSSVRLHRRNHIEPASLIVRRICKL